jgi:hypothetical protein
LLTLLSPVLFFSHHAAADDCIADCLDLDNGTSYCGPKPCQQQPVYTCIPGCGCGTCTYGFGECQCYFNNKNHFYPYSSDGIFREPGDCLGEGCGLRRFHVSRFASRPGPTMSARVRNVNGRSSLGEDDSAARSALMSEGRMFVLSRCSQTYRILVPRPSPKKQVGGM